MRNSCKLNTKFSAVHAVIVSKTVTKKEWAIIAVVVVLAIVGLVFVDGYSTLFFG